MREDIYVLTKAQIAAIFDEWNLDAEKGNWPQTYGNQAEEFCRRADQKVATETEE